MTEIRVLCTVLRKSLLGTRVSYEYGTVLYSYYGTVLLVLRRKSLLRTAVCVNQRLFITNTGPPRGVYTCPHKEGYDVTLSTGVSIEFSIE